MRTRENHSGKSDEQYTKRAQICAEKTRRVLSRRCCKSTLARSRRESRFSWKFARNTPVTWCTQGRRPAVRAAFTILTGAPPLFRGTAINCRVEEKRLGRTSLINIRSALHEIITVSKLLANNRAKPSDRINVHQKTYKSSRIYILCLFCMIYNYRNVRGKNFRRSSLSFLKIVTTRGFN